MVQPRLREVKGEGGVRLHVREFGPENAPPLLFVHGWSQCHLCWKYQTAGPLADRYRLVVFDLRGHGMSEVPAAEDAYTSGHAWAGDVAAVIAQCDLVRPLIVGWSHGSFVVCDYLRRFGAGDVSAVALLSWAVRIGDHPGHPSTIGPGFRDSYDGSTSDDLPTSIAAMLEFIDVCVNRPLAPADRDEMLAYNMIVPPFVRRATGAHEDVDNTDVLAALPVPLWSVHGDADTVVLPSSLDIIAAANPAAEITRYPGAAHAPFLEFPDRFNRELGEFADRTLAGWAH